jgi:hypothetical protein
MVKLDKFLNKLPAYFYRYNVYEDKYGEKHEGGFYKFTELVNNYILNGCNNILDYFEQFNAAFNYDESKYSIFTLQKIADILNVKISDVNKENENYKKYLLVAIKGKIINNIFRGNRESLIDNLEYIFSDANILVEENNMSLEVDVSSNDFVYNIPYEIFLKYTTPKLLGVSSTFKYRYGDIFTYDYDFNEAKEIYESYGNNLSSWLNNISEGSQEYDHRQFIYNKFKDTESYIKYCREIVNYTEEEDEINMWINPSNYSTNNKDKIIVIKTLYGFYSEEKNNSKYIIEV